MTEQSVSRLVIAAIATALLGVALLATLRPDLLAARFAPFDRAGAQASAEAAAAVVRSLALPLFCLGIVGLVTAYYSNLSPATVGWFATFVGVISYGSLQWGLWNWTVDDAAITFAYSENLVLGYGLVLHPAHLPEEGYSSTLWMLILALARSIGFQIDIAAKVLGAICGAAAVLIAMRACARLQAGQLGYHSMLACAFVAIGAPFLIWPSSGLEHGLQALLFVCIAALPLFLQNPIGWTALCLGALVLLRPESPLIVLAVICVYAADHLTERTKLLRLWPLAVVPFAVGAALLAFRLSYFGVPFPNPYYAKASEATLLRVINVFGAGWRYIIDWLSSSGAFMLVPLLLLGLTLRVERTVKLAAALIAAQLIFVLYAGGDWMSTFRFIAPVLPLLAIVLAQALVTIDSRLLRVRTELTALAMTLLLGLSTIIALHRFQAAPTTPTSVVTAIGREFVNLANRLDIKNPTIAHHDAGGTSWAARINVLDLGGLGDRAIAQHMSDPQFMRNLLFVERRPTFIFGSSKTFAAGGTGFFRMPEYAEQYVPVRFPGLGYMAADLSAMRRDLVHQAPGISLETENGRLVAVVVENEGVKQPALSKPN